ncbi:iron-containing alcohol dehydrogenase [Pectobacterium versatile]|uniref:iron-containing alcohol dehydrogenase n=1 Tax=Pectobacterium versatile TaxID=2488639 RepID=UPI003019BE99
MIAIQAPQTYLNRDGVIRSVGEYAAPYASTVLIITSPQAWKTTSDAVERSLSDYGLRYQVEFLPGDCTKPAIKAQAARLAVETFNTYGEQAIADNEQGLVTPALRSVIDAVIALAGLANSMKDEVPRIGVAHAIHNSMTRLPELHDWLHGEKVGFGLAAQAFLEHDNDADREELFAQLRRYGSPITLSALGLNERPQLIESIAQNVKIAPKIAARLPFATDAERIEQALWRTQTLETSVIDSHAA